MWPIKGWFCVSTASGNGGKRAHRDSRIKRVQQQNKIRHPEATCVNAEREEGIEEPFKVCVNETGALISQLDR